MATWFFIRAVEFLSSAQQFSSLPARTVTKVPSPTSPRATTLKATGRVLLDLQWAGNTLQTKCGEPVIELNIPNLATGSWKLNTIRHLISLVYQYLSNYSLFKLHINFSITKLRIFVHLWQIINAHDVVILVTLNGWNKSLLFIMDSISLSIVLIRI